MTNHKHNYNKQRRCECGALEPQDPKIPKLSTRDTIKPNYLKDEQQ